MPTEIMIEEPLEELISLGDSVAPSPRECDAPVFQPWSIRSDADWLFEILMA